MISRRGARIKVLQVLYATTRDPELTKREARKAYRDSVGNLYDLYLFAMYAIVKICQIAEEDVENRKTKYLPTEADKTFDARLYQNEIIQNFANNKTLYQRAEQLRFRDKVTLDFARKLYSEFNKTEECKKYIAITEPIYQDHLDILLELFRFCRKSEYFLDVMEDGFSNWIDDKSLVVGAVKKTLKDKGDPNVFDQHIPDPEIVNEFGEELLEYFMDEEEELLEYIKPVLDNWDHERLAVIDNINIKLALSEFLGFETIPVKVSINEYVELSKRYSTPKSKEFVNGILDKLLTELKESGKIVKTGKGLLE